MATFRWWFGLISILAVAAAAVAFVWTCHPAILVEPPPASGAGSCPALRGTIVTEGVKLVMQLAVVGVLGGFAKLLLDALATARLQREANLATLRGFLGRLNEAKARVVRSRETLRSHETLPDYRNQVDELVNARSALEALSTEIEASGDILPKARFVAEVLRAPRDFLTAVIDEKAERDAVIAKMHAAGRDESVVEYLRKYCEALQDLREAPEAGRYRADFLNGIKTAADLLQHSIVGKP